MLAAESAAAAVTPHMDSSETTLGCGSVRVSTSSHGHCMMRLPKINCLVLQHCWHHREPQKAGI
jgi:hypothetical protein